MDDFSHCRMSAPCCLQGDMSRPDLISMLQNALAEHHHHPKRPKVTSNPQSLTASAAIRYISGILLEEEEDPYFSLGPAYTDSYRKLYAELSSIISLRPPPLQEDPRCPIITGENHTGNRVLKSMLVESAQALLKNDVPKMFQILKAVQRGVSKSNGVWMPKLALCFVDGLVARLTGTGCQSQTDIRSAAPVIPYAFANYTILERCQGAKRVHIIDYGIDHGYQWPWLIKAFSERPEGPPHITITGVDHPKFINVENTRKKLLDCAATHGVTLNFECILTSTWETACPVVWRTDEEVVIVQCILKSAHLKEDGTTAITNPRKLWLESIYKMQPSLFLQCESGSTIGTPFFLNRFQQAVHYNCGASEEFVGSVLATLKGQSGNEVSDELLHRNMRSWIINQIACDEDDLLRPASYKEWTIKLRRAGFEQVRVSESVSDVIYAMAKEFGFLRSFGYLRQDDHWLVIGSKNTIAYAMSAWQT